MDLIFFEYHSISIYMELQCVVNGNTKVPDLVNTLKVDNRIVQVYTVFHSLSGAANVHHFA